MEGPNWNAIVKGVNALSDPEISVKDVAGKDWSASKTVARDGKVTVSLAITFPAPEKE